MAVPRALVAPAAALKVAVGKHWEHRSSTFTNIAYTGHDVYDYASRSGTTTRTTTYTGPFPPPSGGGVVNSRSNEVYNSFSWLVRIYRKPPAH